MLRRPRPRVGARRLTTPPLPGMQMHQHCKPRRRGGATAALRISPCSNRGTVKIAKKSGGTKIPVRTVAGTPSQLPLPSDYLRLPSMSPLPAVAYRHSDLPSHTVTTTVAVARRQKCRSTPVLLPHLPME
eukprot:gene15867-biopygen3716